MRGKVIWKKGTIYEEQALRVIMGEALIWTFCELEYWLLIKQSYCYSHCMNDYDK